MVQRRGRKGEVEWREYSTYKVLEAPALIERSQSKPAGRAKTLENQRKEMGASKQKSGVLELKVETRETWSNASGKQQAEREIAGPI